MSKYLIIGDLHCRSIWKDIVTKEEESCDKIIFLGDYTVPRDVQFEDPTDACGFLYDVLTYKDENPDKVVLLRGNHCMDSLGYYWARCYPQDHPKVAQYWQTKDVKRWFLHNTQWIYKIPNTNIVCSHAGCSTVFLQNVENYLLNHPNYRFEPYVQHSIDWILSQINYIEPCELFGFTDNNPFDTSGESPTQPCTWIRPQTLVDCAPKHITQVVGHTPVSKHIFNCKDEYPHAKENIWCCDALGLKEPEYLIIEDGEFKVCTL